jgi:hypothetical protein
MAEIEWVSITKWGPDPIGAIGFIGNDAVAVIAFYDDKDGNQDGKVSWGERIASFLSPISVEGGNVVEVAMQARVEMDIIMRDASFSQVASQMFLKFASGLLMEGIYAVYFSRGVKMVGKGVAKVITNGMVKELVVRKGFETAVKKAFLESTSAPGS